MKVLLAGYNVDADIIEDLKEKGSYKKDNVTPETLSASYARISRDPRAINEIRKDAREEVEKTRKSNKIIIFNLGHSSVAEHAVFNFDIVGVSRLVMEHLEKFRLASYTEKSQRYITLEDDFVLPKEIAESEFAEKYRAVIRDQNALYHKLFERLKAHVFAENSELAQDSKKHALLEGWAKEDARYITSLGTEAQVGMTVNARTLELMLRRFASSPLEEVRELGRMLYGCVEKIAPSIIRYHEANALDQKTYSELREYAGVFVDKKKNINSDDVILSDYDKDGDCLIGSAILYSSSDLTYSEARECFTKMNEDEKAGLFKCACSHLQLYNSVVREYEFSGLTYDLVVSAACFGQLKRHRMTSIVTQPYNPDLGVTIPAAIREVGMEKDFLQIIEKTNDLYRLMKPVIGEAADYVLTNAHQRRVLLRTNVRELYHMSRLREDAHAQWDIRQKTELMRREAAKVMPFSCLLIGAKDVFADVYQKVYGCEPEKISK